MNAAVPTPPKIGAITAEIFAYVIAISFNNDLM
jgi:hypothetical protein